MVRAATRGRPWTMAAPRGPGVEPTASGTAAASVEDDTAPGMQGLFGPGSVTWRVHTDPLVGLAALSSLALRALSPAGLSGVYVSAFDEDPWDRLSRMLRYVGIMTFGSTVEAVAAAARARVFYTSDAGDYGPRLSRAARRSSLDGLLWAHCCQVSSFLSVVRRGGLEITPADQDTYVREQVRLGALLGLDPGDVPSNRVGLVRYLRKVRPHLRMTSTARGLIDAVTAPQVPEPMAALLFPARPPWAPVAGLAFAALPAWARRLYDLPLRSGPAALTPSATTVALHSLRASLTDTA